MATVAKLFGVGTGPGDPELMTLKAVRAIGEADVVAHFCKRGRRGHAHATAARFFAPGTRELMLEYPVTTEIAAHEDAYKAQIGAFYDDSAARVAAELDAGSTVAVLSEGDPLFYGSYMHLHVRLAPRYPTEVVPGVTSMSGCWSAAGLPLTQGDEVLAVLPATMDEALLARRLAEAEAAVILKIGRNLPRVRRALGTAGKLAGAMYVERGTMAGGLCVPLADKPDDAAPYFSLVLVPGWSGRPGGVAAAPSAPA